MTNSARFQTAVLSPRPRGSRLIEVFSPKLRRRLQCYGETAFRQWIRLEANPMVQTFCERPIYFKIGGQDRLADFWVRDCESEFLLLLEDECETPITMVSGIALPVKSIPLAEIASSRMWISNWERMLPTITCCRDVLSASFIHAIGKSITEPTQLSRIERDVTTGDPTLLRAAVFTLLHRGKLHAPILHSEPLSFLTVFEPTGQ